MAIFRKLLYRQLLESSLYKPTVEQWANTVLYFTAGRRAEWEEGPFSPDREDGSYSQVTTTRDDMIVGVRVAASDIAFVAPRHTWTTGVVYSPFNDDKMLTPFYVLNSTNDLYKCIGNNNGKPSIEEPSAHNTTGTFETADGYIWKYIGGLTGPQIATFGSTTVIPLFSNTEVQENAVGGTLDVISVVSPGSGYLRYATGRVGSKVSNTMLRVEGLSDEGINFYANCAFAATGGTGVGILRVISASVSNSSGNFLTLTSNTDVDGTTTYVVAPRLTIRGDGTSANGYVNVSNGAISNVVITNPGIDYSSAVITARSDSGTNAVLKPHIAPPYGHGGNIVNELDSSSLAIVGEFNKSLDKYLPDDITYYQFGLLLNPKDTGGNVITSNVAAFHTHFSLASGNVFTVGERVTGVFSGAYGLVESSNTTITYVKAVRGHFSSGETITGNLSLINETAIDMSTTRYDKDTGDLLYYTNVSAINRNDTVISEKIRCTIDFEG